MIAGSLPLKRLKAETADLHVSAERYIRILDDEATTADYARYLRAMWGYHAPIEEMFVVSSALTSTGFDPAVRRRAHLLAQDLVALGDLGPWARCRHLPAASSLAHLLGIAYVLEGSTLGGRFILAKLAPGLAGIRDHASAFLTGYGSETGSRWREFAALAERELAGAAACDDAVAGARATFACLIDWLALHETPDIRRVREAS